ncbi:M64 family metallopeptidase [Algibacter sp. PT7-4]|uniref:T9SS type A sorting domain-containing protein n=1 Tax=Algibacter ulvanivorans TaxID=3400999 RepID=UPI003AAE8C13
MKSFLGAILLIFNTYSLSAQVFDIEPIKVSGDDDKRINLVILSEGYQASELANFITDATNFSNEMFNESPFKEYANYFNIYAVKVPSNESGADDPETNTFVDTYFNATHNAFGNPYLLYYEIDGNNANNTEAKILSVLADNFPNYDNALILVNSSKYGGSGGKFPMAYNGYWASKIIMHELGHSLFDLKDEYYPGDLLAGEAINMTQETNPNLVKWKNWIATNNVGVYQYTCDGCETNEYTNWYKPHENSIMEFIDKSFNSVCKEGMIEKIYDLVSPIDSFTPTDTTVNNPSLPLNFELNLVKPIPNTLNSTWTLNTVNFANDVDDVSISDTDLQTGENILSVSVIDNTAMLKIDNHETLNIHTISWTINYSTLGIDDIETEVNTYNISMYPNPTENILNLEVKSPSDAKVKAEIISIDGKLVKTETLSGYQNTQIDISHLSQGVYITNFYSGNMRIASKRLVKN